MTICHSKEPSKILNFKHPLELCEGGWVVRNLREMNNSLIPDELIKTLKKETIETLLSEIIQKDVTIVQTESNNWIAWC